ncbi:hypothetical protein LMH87_001070 [Akanthomyces muscarius]|uniref:Glutamine amidotransferase domain-containing protein n=1 Tax=Akanthomyces muscarius TaxID=2231603 RepID=A0A9W8QGN3_AKAMU|nr:hypothetical protein LMH87_001070 [Akanthomyces muscarius]KAJ4155844.1 hypothetical protein LMH87_001070 [Akanthomyces muscarius]
MKILIIKAFAAQGSLETEILGSYVKHIHASRPEASVQVCRPTSGEELPDPAQYDLLIVTGGAFDLLTTEPTPWVQSILELVRTLENGRPGGTKLLGICWGQQVVQLALGGRLGALSEGPRVGVQDIPLLKPQGTDFFGRDVLLLHKFHKRKIASLSDGFVPLAADYEILMSKSRQILTFQSHPEMSAEISQHLLDADTGFYTETASPNPAITMRGIDHAHDGEHVWARILEWASVP